MLHSSRQEFFYIRRYVLLFQKQLITQSLSFDTVKRKQKLCCLPPSYLLATRKPVLPVFPWHKTCFTFLTYFFFYIFLIKVEILWSFARESVNTRKICIYEIMAMNFNCVVYLIRFYQIIVTYGKFKLVIELGYLNKFY